jgi:hypothetical protein
MTAPDTVRLAEPVTRPAVEEACQMLGFDPDTVTALHIDYRRVTALVWEQNTNGHRILVEHRCAVLP